MSGWVLRRARVRHGERPYANQLTALWRAGEPAPNCPERTDATQRV